MRNYKRRRIQIGGSGDPCRNEFCTQRVHAKQRGIEWKLTYEEWIHVWKASGHLHERGNYFGQYVMARYRDEGPYAVDNVRIITVTENTEEARYVRHLKKISIFS
jgi:hypothetical protein